MFEVLGFGCGFGPLTMRFNPPIGGFLYWLRPGTIRLPAFPELPLTGGTTRRFVDVVLYLGILQTCVQSLLSDPVPGEGLANSTMQLLLVLLVVTGLRDKTIFLAARTEVYGSLILTFLLTGADSTLAAKMVVLLIWWGAAFSKLNRHFPSVIAVMLSNSPVIRSARLKRRLFLHHPDDIRPSAVATRIAHGGTIFEFTIPAVLLLSRGGAITTIAAIAMIVFHVFIISSIPMGVPLEWNVFMIYAIGVLFVENAAVGFEALGLGTVAIFGGLVVLVVYGNLAPDRVSFLLSMRYYAGNWATSLWLVSAEGAAKLSKGVGGSSGMASDQLVGLYGEDVTEKLIYKGAAFRVMHSHGRALYGLIPVAGGENHERYAAIEGELVAGMALGWNFGDGHLHHEQLISALQERCGFAPGEVRVILLESQPMHVPTQDYRLVDAATGEFERGTIEVADMLSRQPWTDKIPRQIINA